MISNDGKILTILDTLRVLGVLKWHLAEENRCWTWRLRAACSRFLIRRAVRCTSLATLLYWYVAVGAQWAAAWLSIYTIVALENFGVYLHRCD
jgi:hypothetical protein